jgi:hypothetical protein
MLKESIACPRPSHDGLFSLMSRAVNPPVAFRFEDTGPLSVDLFDPLVDPEWDRLVLTHPGASVFHSSAWARVLVRTYGHRPVYLRFVSAGRTNALFPLMEVRSPLTGCRGISLPFSDFVPPLVFDPGLESEIIECLEEMVRQRKWQYAEVRGSLGPASASLSSTEFFAHSLNLRRAENVIYANFADSTRRAIRKASGSGLTVRVDTTVAALRDFYKLHVGTRKRHGIPPQSWRFFMIIQEEVLSRGLGFIVSAHDGVGRCVAAAVYFNWGMSALYKYGASDARALPLRPNHLVMWHAIRKFVREGSDSLHFGRSSPSNSGLRRFKRSWGAEEELVSYCKVGGSLKMQAEAGPNEFSKKLFRVLPSFLNRWVGAMLYKHLD